MRSFINGNGCIVRNYVEVSKPRVVENAEAFKALNSSPETLGAGEEETAAAEEEVSERQRMEEDVSNQRQDANAAWEIQNEARHRAAEILDEANKKAAMILAEAEASAQEIRAQAKAESERLCAEVVEKARAEIYPKAQAEGYEAGRQSGEEEGKLAFQDARQLFQLAQRAVQEEYAKVDEDLLHLTIKIAERLVRCSLALEPRLLRGIIQTLTLLPQERRGWVLHVAPEDAAWLEREQPPCPCPWIINETLVAGDCFLECQEGYFDARLEAQLDKLEHILREELQYGAMEPVAADSGTN